MAHRLNYVGKSDKYKNVYQYQTATKLPRWQAKIADRSSFHDKEKTAAMVIDKTLIQMGKSPVNVLKKI